MLQTDLLQGHEVLCQLAAALEYGGIGTLGQSTTGQPQEYCSLPSSTPYCFCLVRIQDGCPIPSPNSGCSKVCFLLVYLHQLPGRNRLPIPLFRYWLPLCYCNVALLLHHSDMALKRQGPLPLYKYIPTPGHKACHTHAEAVE